MDATLLVSLILTSALVTPAAAAVDEAAIATPQQALEALKAGNERFVRGKQLGHDFQAGNSGQDVCTAPLIVGPIYDLATGKVSFL